MEYKGIKFDIVEDDGEWCYAFEIKEHTFCMGQFSTKEEAINNAKGDIDEVIRT